MVTDSKTPRLRTALSAVRLNLLFNSFVLFVFLLAIFFLKFCYALNPVPGKPSYLIQSSPKNG